MKKISSKEIITKIAKKLLEYDINFKYTYDNNGCHSSKNHNDNNGCHSSKNHNDNNGCHSSKQYNGHC